MASIPWLSRSSYVQVRLPVVAAGSNAGLGMLCDSATSCIGARLRRVSTTYFLDLGTLASGAFTAATSPVCTTGATCTITVGTTVSTTTDLRLDYNSSTFLMRLTFGTQTVSMTVPVAYRANTRAGLFAITNSDGTRFTAFEVGTQ